MTILIALLAASLVGDVRRSINAGDLPGAERKVEVYRAANGVTPEMLEAFSWLGRGALAAKNFDAAEQYARRTREQVVAALGKRALDTEPRLATALGAAIEVQGQVLAARGDRAGALEYLAGELDSFRNTSIRTRIQKNINLLGLEGKRAPNLEGATIPRGKPALLYFWAHWCPDCKAMAPVIEQLRQAHPGLTVIAPTQTYGYAERGREVPPEEERRYIEAVHKQHYAKLPSPISAENFKVYGASTTPTIVLVDKARIVRLYHPGNMPQEQLAAKIAELLK